MANGRARLFTLSTAFVVALLLGASPVVAKDNREATNLAVFDRVWKTVTRGYYDQTFQGLDWDALRSVHRRDAAKAGSDEALYSAINAMLDKLGDDHTHALSPREARARKRREGVLLGLRLSEIPDTPGHSMVVDVMPGGGAEAQGVQRGWILVTADGERPDDVLGIDKLTAGQIVACTFLDADSEPHELRIPAKRLRIRPIMSKDLLEDGLVYLRFDKFDGASARWLRRQLKMHRDALGVILDLRNNPGGASAALGRSLGEFFKHRVDMGTFITQGGENEHLHTWRWFASSNYQGPVAVLVSSNSGSSAEIFAAVVKHHKRAVTIGERTGGAVLAARFRKLPDGGLLGFSVLDYVAPDGTRLEKQGVEPDIPVEMVPDDIRSGVDRALEVAIRNLTAKQS